MEAVQTMNGTLWVFAVIVIAMVIVQSLLFLRLALRFNAKNKVCSSEEIQTAARTGAIAAIGPAFSTMTIALSLIVMVGPAATYLRCGVIGAPSWELYMASICTSILGVEFGTAEFTTGVFTLCLFGMTLASAPYFINTIITLKPLDNVLAKSEKKENKRSFLPYMSLAAMMALTTYMIYDYANSAIGFVAALSGGLVTYLIVVVARKIGNKTLSSFGMGIGMIAAMIVGECLTIMM